MKKKLVLAGWCALSLVAQAETDPRVAQLEKRLDTLEQQLAQVGSGTSSADTGLPLHGFADVDLGRTTPREARPERGVTGASIGNLDLYLSPSFGSSVKSLVELVFEVDHNGELSTDLERVQVGYTFSDAATVWLGRFHTPYGVWNTAFHHGQQIQTAASRPTFIDFEDRGGILPAHNTGLWLTGGTGTGIGKLGYDLYVSNAPEIAVDGATGKGSLDMKMGGKGARLGAMTGFNVSLRPLGLSDLTVGLHGFGANVDAVDDTATLLSTTRVRVGGGYLNFQNDQWEVIGEYYRFRNRDVNGAAESHRSTAWFAQAGYGIGNFTPYLRAEKTRLDGTDQYFARQESGESYKRSVGGVRYELDPKAALKVEASRTRFTDAGTTSVNFSEVRLQLAVRF